MVRRIVNGSFEFIVRQSMRKLQQLILRKFPFSFPSKLNFEIYAPTGIDIHIVDSPNTSMFGYLFGYQATFFRPAAAAFAP